jgi:SAM-dependent methyltransferase
MPFPKAEELQAFYPSVYTFSRRNSKRSPWHRLFVGLEYRTFYRPMYRTQARRIMTRVANREMVPQGCAVGVTPAEITATAQCSGGQRPRLLDIGCGSGLLLEALGRYQLELDGMDFRPEAVEHVHEHMGVHAICGDVDRLPELFPPESFDVVTAFHLLEHVVDVVALLGQCRTLLKPGGWLVAAVPLVDAFQASYFRGRWMMVTEAPRHVTLPTRRGMVVACERAGFRNISAVPDAIQNCTAVFAMSLVPQSTTANAAGGNGVGGIIWRCLAGAISFLATPWCLIENYVLRRPASGIIFAQRPE